ncbi:hypothetical protein P885DRAFT_73440 [Corynascus similis CBS 632.67]
MVKPRREKQQTLEATLGRPRVRPTVKTPRKSNSREVSGILASSSPAKVKEAAKSPPLAPPSSFMHSSQVHGSARKNRVVYDDSSSEATSEGEVQRVELPTQTTRRGRQPQRSRSESSDSSSDGEKESREESNDVNDVENEQDEDDEDDKPLAAPTPRRKRLVIADESDEDDQPIVSSPAKRRRLIRRNNASNSPKASKDDEDSVDEALARSSARATRARRKPLTQKEKARELLRRKRAGEVINEDENMSSSAEEEPAKAMYDTDSDNLVLNEFEDDEEGVYEPQKDDEKKAKVKKKKKVAEGGDSGTESMDDFVVDDSDAPIGAPELDIPLEFTRHSHKHLKEHFRDAIEWLVQIKVNPGFAEREHPVYRMAWRKLDDEVRGLATSKFSSSAWKTDFYMALRARPEFTNGELPKGDMLGSQSCGACGRSGHPARHMITFTGTPYFKDATKLYRFLQPVEINSSDSDAGSEPHDEDEDGNLIPKESKQWLIGAVCNSNAETAHTLMHWKHSLLTWVETRLHEEGLMAPAKLAERERMRPKEKYKLVDKIMARWVDGGVVKALFQDFKGTIEQARNKPTTGRYR